MNADGKSPIRQTGVLVCGQDTAFLMSSLIEKEAIMCKRLICSIFFVSLLCPAVDVTKADLVAYWPMDEGAGTTIGDYTGAWDGTDLTVTAAGSRFTGGGSISSLEPSGGYVYASECVDGGDNNSNVLFSFSGYRLYRGVGGPGSIDWDTVLATANPGDSSITLTGQGHVSRSRG